MAKPSIDESGWPIVLIVLPPNVSAEDFEEHFVDLRELGERTSGAIFAVVETSGLHLSAVIRTRVGNALRDLAERFGSRISGVAYVADSVATRGVVTAIHWIAGPSFPTATFARRADAIQWCQERSGR